MTDTASDHLLAETWVKTKYPPNPMGMEHFRGILGELKARVNTIKNFLCACDIVDDVPGAEALLVEHLRQIVGMQAINEAGDGGGESRLHRIARKS